MLYEVPDEPQPRARAYVYQGEWVADCPRPGDETGRPGCANVEFLYRPVAPNGPRTVPLDFYICSYCGYQAMISWPRRREEIVMALSVRPVPANRNWYPKDHPVAVRFNIPHGQTVAELMAENEQHNVSNESLKGLR